MFTLLEKTSLKASHILKYHSKLKLCSQIRLSDCCLLCVGYPDLKIIYSSGVVKTQIAGYCKENNGRRAYPTL